MSGLTKTAALAAATLLVLLTTGAANPGVKPGTAKGAELVKTGWWWAANESPLDDTVVAQPQQSAPNVPKGALPVSAAAGEPEKFSALEFRVDAEPGAFADKAVLVLRENTEPGATVNAENATILACPVTETFWADGASAAWRARPSYDCDLASAPGERDAKTGIWKFDLAAVASMWVAEGGTGATSVALVEGVEPPESFQVVFDGLEAEGIGFAFKFSDAPDDDGFPLTDDAAGGEVTTGTTGTTGGSGASGGALTGSIAGGGTGAAGPLADTAEVAPVDAAAEPTVAEAAEATAFNPVAAPYVAPAWYSGIPAAGYALLPLMLGLAYLLMLALGPDAQPAAGPTQRGVGRALERLRTVGAAITTRGKN
jgi:hypothetical protein